MRATSVLQRHHRSRGRVVALVVLAGTLGGCAQIPTDPGRTLERVRAERVLRAGASHHPPRVVVPGPEAEPTGPETDLVRAYARHLGARVEWTVDSETALVEALDEGEVDVVAAGLEETSPWAAEVGATRPYAETTDPDGTVRAHVLAVPAGENALQSDLERWLDDEAGGAR